MKNVDDLFLHFLQDIYYAENQILKALPKMEKAAEDEELRQALATHRQETEGQVERLNQVFAMLDKTPRGKTCEAIRGLIEEGEEIIDGFEKGPVRDAGILACAQAVEHYEMARYRSLISWSGDSKAVALLRETLDEEEHADEVLTELAETVVNEDAASETA